MSVAMMAKEMNVEVLVKVEKAKELNKKNEDNKEASVEQV